MKLMNFILIALMAVSLTVISCSEDEDETPTDPNGGSEYDPNIFCDENLCANNDELKQECIDRFNYCIENEPDLNDDECVGMALFACRVQ